MRRRVLRAPCFSDGQGLEHEPKDLFERHRLDGPREYVHDELELAPFGLEIIGHFNICEMLPPDDLSTHRGADREEEPEKYSKQSTTAISQAPLGVSAFKWTLVIDNLLFETDYPHPVYHYGNVSKKIDSALKAVCAGDRHKVLFENAAKRYRIDLSDVAPSVPVRQRRG